MVLFLFLFLLSLRQILHFAFALAASMKIKDLCIQELEEVKSGVRFTPVHGIATSGRIYSQSRNPLYVLLLWIMGAWAVLVNSTWFLGAMAVMWAYFQYWVIPVEERFLTQRFGPEYQEYCHQTPQWLSLSSSFSRFFVQDTTTNKVSKKRE
jgi:protein-S-isoprenylcysteine O-methyltransferase Ste14